MNSRKDISSLERKVLKRTIGRTFKQWNRTLENTAMNALISVLSKESDPDQALNVILPNISTSGVIDQQEIARVVADLSRNESDIANERYQVFDSFKLPKLQAAEDETHFLVQSAPLGLHLDPSVTVSSLLERVNNIRSRTNREIRNRETGETKNGEEVLSLNQLISKKETNCVVFGMIRQTTDGVILEDSNVSVKVIFADDFTANFGFFCDGFLVLCEGHMQGREFVVQYISLPPCECRTNSLSVTGPAGLLGLHNRTHDIDRMESLKSEHEKDSVVMLSEVHLDNAEVMEKLERLFEGWQGWMDEDPHLQVPIILMIGSFWSSKIELNPDVCEEYEQAMKRLAKLINRFDRFKSSRFVFVPGPNDPLSSSILPQKRICHRFTGEFERLGIDANFVSNPARLRCFTQEIVVFRNNFLDKFQKAQIFPSEGEESVQAKQQKIAQTILDESHLLPLSSQNSTIHHQFDYSLRLFPLPDYLLLVDANAPCQFGISDCQIVGIGNFATGGDFCIFKPAVGEFDHCVV
eukprot:TRINITY_DN67804_c0_g1_i1.p1 TRINITY_DN67804_c0_g1~~TRINITY_DN67804_c0_g1_i1.p1  ORF type:complete len:524 (-),score=99.04 TRINITY_DN67804_c0_g1_i1:244-1815(-)